jgi:signal transduction histidine kinase
MRFPSTTSSDQHTPERQGRRILSLRMRLALSYAALAFVLSFSLLFFVNITAVGRFYDVIQKAKIGSLDSLLSKKPVIFVPGGLVNASEKSNSIEIALLNGLESISLLGLGLVTMLGGLGAYWLAGVTLRPVRKVSQAACRISAETLGTRLNLSGPRDEIRELADAFDTMLARLERAFERQECFVGNAAHELRTPLASMRANLEVVTTNPLSELDDYREMAAAQERALSRLEALTSNLLILMKSEQPLREPQVVSLGPLLEEVLQQAAPLAGERQITLHLSQQESDELVVQGNSVLLEHAFWNLVENAICYNHSGGEVRACLERRGKQALVSIADTGPGIPPQKQEHIFERFYRVASARARHTSGTGLGLSITQAVVQQHGGEVCVSSIPGSGCVFTIALPLYAISPPASSDLDLSRARS